MKKSQKIIIACIFLLFVSGCHDVLRYNDNNLELQVIASHSLLVKGKEDDNVIVVEHDKYGRTLFLYVAKSLGGRVISLLVSQKTTETDAYFYDGINYLVDEETTLKNNNGASIELIQNHFTADQIETLKETNDWNEPINESKLFKVEIAKRKYHTVSDELLEKAFMTVSPYYSYPFTYYIETDKNGKSVYLMIGQRYDDQLKTYVDDQAFLFMFDKSGNLVGPNAIEPIDDLWHYQQQLYNFKLKNGWAFYQ